MVQIDQQIKQIQIRFRSLVGFPTTDHAVVFDRVGASTVRFRSVAVFAPLCGIARLRRRCALIHSRASERRGGKTRQGRVRIAGAIPRKRAPKRRGRAPDWPARRAATSDFPFYTAFTLTTGELNARPPLEMRRSNSPAASLNFPAPPTEGGGANERRYPEVIRRFASRLIRFPHPTPELRWEKKTGRPKSRPVFLIAAQSDCPLRGRRANDRSNAAWESLNE